MKRYRFLEDKRKSKKRKTSDDKRTLFLPSIIPPELISQIMAFLTLDEYGKLVFLNREWNNKIWRFLTSFTIIDISVTKNGPVMDQLAKNITSLEVRQFELNDNDSPKVDWLGKFRRLRNLTIRHGGVEKIASIVPWLTSLTVDYITGYEEFRNMTNLRALFVQSLGFSVMKGLVNMQKLERLHIDTSFELTYKRFHHISKLTNLTHLTFQDCQITEKNLLHLAVLTSLKELLALDESYFVDNRGMEECVTAMRGLTALRDLEVLKLEYGDVGDTDLIAFKKLTRLQLEELRLSFELPPNLKSLQARFLNATIDKYIDKFINLTELDLQLNDDETSEDFESIAKLQELTRLCIISRFDKGIQEGLTALTLLPRLKVLKFWVTDDGNISMNTILNIISNIPSLIEFHCNEKALDSIQKKVPHMLCLSCDE